MTGKEVNLEDILITEKFWRRVARAPDWRAEALASRELARHMVSGSESLLQNVVEVALNLCRAGSAGVSPIETNKEGERFFRWKVVGGSLGSYTDGISPYELSPCGVCLSLGAPQLYDRPGRYFPYLQAARPPIFEALVLPLMVDNQAFGTIWIVSHDPERHFDPEDARVMTGLADFTAAAMLIDRRRTRELRAENADLITEIKERERAEERALALVENLPGGAVFVVDRDFRYLLAEGEALTNAGFQPADLVGKTIFEALAPELSEKYRLLYANVLAGGTFEYEHEAHGHSYISRGTPLRSADGEVYAALAVSYDITARERAEAALRESEAKFRFLFESINDGFALIEVLYNEDDTPAYFRFLEVSPSFEIQTGLKGVQGKTSLEVDPNVERGFIDNYDLVVKTGKARNFEIWNQLSGQWYDVRALPYGEREERRLAIVFTNINDRKRAEAERLKAEEERRRVEALAALDRVKTRFFSDISHELRTPLTLILSPLQEMLERGDGLQPEVRERIELAHRNASRLLRSVNNLLDFSRIEAGRIDAVYEPTDLGTFTGELVSLFRPTIEREGLKLTVHCPPLAEPVYIDRQMWEKIVFNLLSNAFKFTFEGEIEVTVSSNPENAVLEVRDTGTGIAGEDLPRLFERFYRVRGARARTYQGSGIGLTLVHELIRLQGGSIGVESTIGRGTRFTVTIPRGSDHLSADRIRDDRSPIATVGRDFQKMELCPRTAAVAPSPEVRTGARVLLVDDHADTREYLTRLLSEYVQVEAVADGATALKVARERVPDLVLSDVMMPGLDGFGLLKALREDTLTAEVPVILLSARAGEEAIVSGLEAGADDYLIKPFSASELISRVNTRLRIARSRSEVIRFERGLNRDKDELFSIVAHELNTPLVAILGWTRLLKAAPESSLSLKALETIERNALLQAKLVRDLSDISRIAAGKLRLNFQRVDLGRVIETAIASLVGEAAFKNIEIIFEKPEREGEVVVNGDRERLHQILSNLLTNAIKFTPRAGRVRVELSRPDNGRARIRVIDTGIGIPKDFLPHIFERFRQAREVDTSRGLGLGLSIARHLVQLHGGDLTAESAGEGEGSTFSLQLPIVGAEGSFLTD